MTITFSLDDTTTWDTGKMYELLVYIEALGCILSAEHRAGSYPNKQSRISESCMKQLCRVM
jgi:hypothetical protein